MPSHGQLLVGSLWLGLSVLPAVCIGSGGTLQPVCFGNFRQSPLELRLVDGLTEGVSLGEVPAMDKICRDEAAVGHKYRLYGTDEETGEKIIATEFEMRSGQNHYMLGPAYEDRENPSFLAFREIMREERARKKSVEL
mmetsp:Transcript_128826/g.349715  ORF Transcript_128826/g.349715 Transcript_128826/m.349715 type:complete len:138 (-) Transcript_128826:165-578(-)